MTAVETVERGQMVERPADFTVALVNPAYISVKLGTVLASNGHGTVPLNAGR